MAKKRNEVRVESIAPAPDQIPDPEVTEDAPPSADEVRLLSMMAELNKDQKPMLGPALRFRRALAAISVDLYVMEESLRMLDPRLQQLFYPIFRDTLGSGFVLGYLMRVREEGAGVAQAEPPEETE